MGQNPLNVQALKNSNRARVLECIRSQPISRIEISRQTGLTKSAVTMLTNEMISEGLLYELGFAEKTANPGRTSILLDIVADYAYAIGVTLHRRYIGVCISDLKLSCIAKTQRDIAFFTSADETVQWINSSINALLSKVGIPLSKCVGIGISSPGPLDYTKGIILKPPHFPLFENYPIAEKLKQYFPIPIFLENNSVTLALTNYYKQRKTKGNELFVVIANGIGSTLLQNGNVFRGSQGFAGELGHVSVNSSGEYCSCGNRGCLELYATLQALKDRFAFESYEDLMNNAIKGNEKAMQAISFLVDHLGMALAVSTNLFDLDRIVLFGEYSYRANLLVSQLEDYIRNHSLIYRVHPIKVLPAKITLQDADIASSISALNFFFNQTNRKN